MRRIVVVVGLVMLFVTFGAAPVMACSGGETPPTPIEELLTRSVFVRATVIESSANNHMLAVDRYLIGSGPRILFLNRESPADWALYSVRGYDTGCHFGGAIASLGTTAYFALDREDTGTYKFHASAPGIGEEMFRVDYDGTMSYWTMIDPAGDPDDYDNYERHALAEDEFIAFVAELSGQEPSTPSVLLPPPLNPVSALCCL